MIDDARQLRQTLRGYLLGTTRKGRRRLALERGELHSGVRKPGLTGIDRQGTVVSTDDVTVHWYEAGPEDADLTVVFIHGFTLAAESWFRQVDYLREYHPRVRSVLMDLRGHGQTGAVSPELCTVDSAADDVCHVLGERVTSGRVIVVGHSLGGLVALAVLRRAQEELHERICSVVLAAASIETLSAQGIPQVLASPVADKLYDVVEASPQEVNQLREQAAAILAPGLAVTVFQRDVDFELVEFHAAMIHETPLETFVGYFDDLQHHDELAATPYLVGKPGFVLAGQDDAVTPIEQARRITELWPQAWLQVAESAGHMLPLEAPGIVNNALNKLIVMAGEEQD